MLALALEKHSVPKQKMDFLYYILQILTVIFKSPRGRLHLEFQSILKISAWGAGLNLLSMIGKIHLGLKIISIIPAQPIRRKSRYKISKTVLNFG